MTMSSNGVGRSQRKVPLLTGISPDRVRRPSDLSATVGIPHGHPDKPAQLGHHSSISLGFRDRVRPPSQMLIYTSNPSSDPAQM
jgi:hypothetical protein